MGRPKGSKNRKNSPEAVGARSARNSLTPLDYMIAVYRNPRNSLERRDRMAAAAANYVHSKLQASTVQHSGTLTLETLVTEAIKNPPAE